VSAYAAALTTLVPRTIRANLAKFIEASQKALLPELRNALPERRLTLQSPNRATAVARRARLFSATARLSNELEAIRYVPAARGFRQAQIFP
jgi:hypothetical protein